MKTIHILTNPVQKYAWGSHAAIAELTGRPFPIKEPEAEMWMGAHPKAPSTVKTKHGDESLMDLIKQYPHDIIGKAVASFENRLPYLFKVLAIEEPLSIQVHPNREQAKKGFARENHLGIPMDAAERNYRDDNHKPECICALTHFWALNGFHGKSTIIRRLKEISSNTLDNGIRELEERADSQGLKRFLDILLNLKENDVEKILDRAVPYAEARRSQDPIFDWMVRLHNTYPGDIGVLFPLILNLVRLNPGQAMYLPAGQMHAYLKGVGIELMANSDNVLRGGLTPKHVDVAELLNVLNFEEQPLEIIKPVKRNACQKVFPTPADEFELSVIETRAGRIYTSDRKRSAEILLVTSGEVTVGCDDDSEPLKLKQGMSAIVPAAVETYWIKGKGTVYKAGLPLSAFK
ncbi:MAG: mannose-6-phosphate isomerase, class I [Thermodesulfobacteriota bacterium]